MSRPGHIWKKLAFKGLFSIVGLILFIAQVSYKFYYSASMPVYRAPVSQHHEAKAVSGTDTGAATLSLDKRFDLKPSFALLTPVYRFLHYSTISTIVNCFIVPPPGGNTPVLPALRGPPSSYTALS